MLSDASFVYSPSDWSALTGTVPFYADAGLCGGVVQATFEVTFNDSELIPLPEPALSTMLGASIALLGIVGRKRCQSR